MRFLTSSQFQVGAIIVMVALLGASLCVPPPKIGADKPAPYDHNQTVGNRLQQMHAARAEFLVFLNEILDRVAWRKLSLMDGIDRVLDYCQQKYPLYLANLDYLPRGRNLRERIAWNFFLHVQGEFEVGNRMGWPPDFAQRLEEELTLLVS